MRSCETCMQANSITERQVFRCGREAPAPASLPTQSVYLPSWPPAEPMPDTCPGYLASLPQVIEGARAREWRTNLETFTAPHAPTPALVRAVELAGHAFTEVEHWNATPYEEGGGMPPRPT